MNGLDAASSAGQPGLQLGIMHSGLFFLMYLPILFFDWARARQVWLVCFIGQSGLAWSVSRSMQSRRSVGLLRTIQRPGKSILCSPLPRFSFLHVRTAANSLVRKYARERIRHGVCVVCVQLGRGHTHTYTGDSHRRNADEDF